jgi:hypothetical protein
MRKLKCVRVLPFSLPSFLFAPFFLFFALHCRRVSVLHLEPIGRAAGTVWRILPLRDNAFEAELAGVPKYGLAVTFHVLVEPGREGTLQHSADS